jgi:flagellar basal-body rod protein FlgC
MDYARLFAISAAGMAVERTRVEVAAMNLANATTVQTADGAGYQPMRVVARTSAAAAPSFAEQVDQGLDGTGLVPGLPEAVVETSGAAARLVHDPSNPFADTNGDVAYPGVDNATEMVTLMTAMRAYEANVAAMNVSRALVLKTLELGGAT